MIVTVGRIFSKLDEYTVIEHERENAVQNRVDVLLSLLVYVTGFPTDVNRKIYEAK